MRKFTAILCAILFLLPAIQLRADHEGMWIPLLLDALNEEEMQALGMEMTAEDIYSINQSSLKDGIAHFGGKCTSEVISATGLLLTNHHCGYDEIQAHSTFEKNYLKNGFWAMAQSEELPNPNLFARFIVRIEDVTEKALDGTEKAATPEARQSVIDQNLNRISATAKREDHQEAFIRPFYKGNQYFLFITETYRDVRLVAAPPESIGKFGADTDNWVWPRHTGDFSLFRIYASPDNKPAEYAPENVPYTPKHFFPISLDGVEVNDFTLVFGFPGTTNQYLPADGLEMIQDVLDPARIAIRDISLGIMDKYMRADEGTRLQYAAKYANLANSWKKWIGEAEGLEKVDAVAKRKAYETEFVKRIGQKKKWSEAYGHLLPEFETLYKEIQPYSLALNCYNEVFTRNVEIFNIASRASRLLATYRYQGEPGYNSVKDGFMAYLEGFFKDYHAQIDREILQKQILLLRKTLPEEFLAESLRNEYLFMRGYDTDEIGAQLFGGSVLDDPDQLIELAETGPEAFGERMEKDPLMRMYVDIVGFASEQISPRYTAINNEISGHMTTYMKAQMEVFSEKVFWPDANNTLRVSYGQVDGYSPRDAVEYSHVTYLDGVMEKYVPGDYEFDVDPKLIRLFEQRDYGPYGEDGKMPVCFIGKNHTTGGNSGSPAIDGKGNLIGINFDRVWEGTMSDLYYDPSICRNIMVDIRYVLFVIDKFGGAGHLVSEMKLVHPKQE